MVRLKKESARELGFALLPTLLFVILMAFFTLILIDLVRSDSVRSNGNLQQSILRRALSVGAENAANQLNGYTNWPEIISQSGTSLPGYQNIAATASPTTPTVSFWSNCVSANTCLQSSVTISGSTVQIQWTIEPSNGYSTRIGGYAVQPGHPGPSARTYLAFVRASAPSGESSVGEFVLRKAML